VRTAASAHPPDSTDPFGEDEEALEVGWLIYVPLAAAIAVPTMFYLGLGLPGLALGVSLVVATALAWGILVAHGLS
jgi:hypothetical protein